MCMRYTLWLWKYKNNNNQTICDMYIMNKKEDIMVKYEKYNDSS